ncbi:MAG: LPS export ABC transporter periplasmic protein LptC [Elusimicrobiota bacterium]
MKALVVLLALCVTSCARSSSGPPEQARQVMEDFTMTQTVAGTRLWQLGAPEARITLEGEARLDSPEILFYRHGEHVTTARAREASVDGETKDVSLKENVVITAHGERTTLYTSRLDYSSRDQRFRTKAAVTVERPGARVRGRGLEADAALTDITVYHQETVLR